MRQQNASLKDSCQSSQHITSTSHLGFARTRTCKDHALPTARGSASAPTPGVGKEVRKLLGVTGVAINRDCCFPKVGLRALISTDLDHVTCAGSLLGVHGLQRTRRRSLFWHLMATGWHQQDFRFCKQKMSSKRIAGRGKTQREPPSFPTRERGRTPRRQQHGVAGALLQKSMMRVKMTS